MLPEHSEISPGKSIFLPPIPAGSTITRFLCSSGFALKCTLTPVSWPPYPISVRQYRILQSRFLHSGRRRPRACGLLMLRGTTPAHKGLSPSGKTSQHTLFIRRKTLDILKSFYKFAECVSCIRCSCRAHTSVCYQRRGGAGGQFSSFLYICASGQISA